MTTADEALREVLRDPHADGPRLAWADAIEAEDPARAELVRVQCQRATQPDDAELLLRERVLLTKHKKRWLKPHQRYLSGGRLARGFLTAAYVKMKPVLADPEGLFGTTPLSSLYTRTFSNQLAKTSASMTFLEGLSALELSECKLQDAGLQALLGSGRLRRVRRLRLDSNALKKQSVSALLAWDGITDLESLNLSSNKLVDADLQPLLGATQLSALRHLGLAGGLLAGLDGMVSLVNSLALPQLESLDLSRNRIAGGDDLHTLKQCHRLATLRRLLIANNEIGGFGALCLRDGPWQRLEELLIDQDNSPTPALAELAKGAWPRLRRLTYWQAAPISVDQMTQFAAGAWPALESLRLTGLEPGALAVLANSRLAAQLTDLDLTGQAFGDRDMQALLANPWPELRQLELFSTSETALEQLAASANFPNIHTLCLGSLTTTKSKRALQQRFGPALIDTPRWRRDADQPAPY